jgi:hypothetical protein
LKLYGANLRKQYVDSLQNLIFKLTQLPQAAKLIGKKRIFNRFL